MTGLGPPSSLVGHLSCGSRIALDAECLGKSFATRTLSYELSIHLPELPVPWSNILLEPPRQVSPRIKADVVDSREEVLKWGLVTDWSTGSEGTQTPSTAAMLRFGFTAKAAVDDSRRLENIRQSVLSELDSWWKILCSWIAVINGQDPEGNSGAVKATRQEPIWTWVDGESRRRGQAISEDLPRAAKGVEALSLATLSACIDLAGSGQIPPGEWVFIRDARAAAAEGDYRRAVIDAGTAAELAITELLDQHLALVDPTLSESLLKRARALEGRSTLMKELGAGLEPIGFTKGLKNPRNAAAHKGHRPSKQDAVRAIEIAVELVEQSTPLLSLIP